MEKNASPQSTSQYDFTVVFDKLHEELSLQSENFNVQLEESKETIDTIALFRDFQESSYPSPISFYTRS